MYKHLFFDCDGTLTESRQEISQEMYDTLVEAKSEFDIIVISGAEKERIVKQLKGLDLEIMAQSGNDTQYWQNLLTRAEKARILEHISKFETVLSSMIDDRGCQISLSFTGHRASVEFKKSFDPDSTVRQRLLKKNPFIHKTLECRIAGSTCLDYTRKNGTKGKNIERLIKLKNWNKKDCIYFGDKLFKGGNDESVIGVIKVVEVSSPTDLLSKFKNNVY